jgi:hypothetical protein
MLIVLVFVIRVIKLSLLVFAISVTFTNVHCQDLKNADRVLNFYLSKVDPQSQLDSLNTLKCEFTAWLDMSLLEKGGRVDVTNRQGTSTHKCIRKSPMFELDEVYNEKGELTARFFANGIDNCNLIFNDRYPTGLMVKSVIGDRVVSLHIAKTLKGVNTLGELKYLGDSLVGSVKYLRLKGPLPFSKSHRPVNVFYFDSNSGLLDFYHELQEPHIVTSLDDYRDFNGILFPLIKQSSSNGAIFYLEKTLILQLHVDADPKIFKCVE